MSALAFLERSDFLRDASQKSKELLAGICIPKQVSKKEVLFREGEKGYAIYLLAAGAVGLYKGRDDGREVVVKMIQPVELFAEVILFEVDRYPVSAVALKPSRVFLIPKHQFCCLLDTPGFRNDFIAMLMKKQRYLAERIKYLTIHDVEERFFLFIREHFGDREEVIPALSKKDIAASIGTTPETYSRLTARLSREGKIAIEGNSIRILDWDL